MRGIKGLFIYRWTSYFSACVLYGTTRETHCPWTFPTYRHKAMYFHTTLQWIPIIYSIRCGNHAHCNELASLSGILLRSYMYTIQVRSWKLPSISLETVKLKISFSIHCKTFCSRLLYRKPHFHKAYADFYKYTYYLHNGFLAQIFINSLKNKKIHVLHCDICRVHTVGHCNDSGERIISDSNVFYFSTCREYKRTGGTRH